MKHYPLALFVLSLILTTSGIRCQTMSEEPNGKLEIIFSSLLTFNDLVTIKNDLQSAGITLDYSKIEFDQSFKLKRISFHVDCNDGFNGFASEEILTDESRIGFYRDYSENAKSPFGIGKI